VLEVRDKEKRTTVQGRKKKAAARASATYISYNREGARLWRDRFNRETREKTERDKREGEGLYDRERDRARQERGRGTVR
jgi:hypothetical protein